MLADSFFFMLTLYSVDRTQWNVKMVPKLMYNVSYCKYLVYEKELISQQQWPVSLVRDTF